MYKELKRRILEFDNGLWPDDMKRIIKEVESLKDQSEESRREENEEE